ncbi:hypothetical protein [Oleidesulfovibrio sp.]|uniref:hypothetical protein n=1 Tax=Oleidesulfovibrio sp. TaxID=2909707 RepID=UPI003A8AC243
MQHQNFAVLVFEEEEYPEALKLLGEEFLLPHTWEEYNQHVLIALQNIRTQHFDIVTLKADIAGLRAWCDKNGKEFKATARTYYRNHYFTNGIWPEE